jgi:hypothetical protein
VSWPGWRTTRKTPTQPAPRLTHDQYIVLMTFAESSNGSYPAEAIRRVAWVAWNHVGSADAFDSLDKTWGGQIGQWPTWDETIIYFIDPASIGVTDKAPNFTDNDYASVHQYLTDEEKRWALSKANDAYSSAGNGFHKPFQDVEDTVHRISDGEDRSDPTNGNIGLYTAWAKAPQTAEQLAQQLLEGDTTAHVYICPDNSQWPNMLLVTHY